KSSILIIQRSIENNKGNRRLSPLPLITDVPGEMFCCGRAADVGESARESAVQHAAAACAGTGSDIDNPVRVGHHCEIVFDQYDCIALPDQPFETGEQSRDIILMQPGRRLIEYENLPCCLAVHVPA